MAVTCPVVFGLALFRVRKGSRRFPGMMALLFFTPNVCASYHTNEGRLALFPSFFLLYCVLGVAATWLVTQTVAPTPAGLLARVALAGSFRISGRLAVDLTALLMGPLNERGRLAQATGTGRAGGSVNVDQGLYEPIMKLHRASYEGGKRVTSARMHGTSARLEIDLYRPTHFFPFRAFFKLHLLCRWLLSTVTTMIYPVQVCVCVCGGRGGWGADAL